MHKRIWISIVIAFGLLLSSFAVFPSSAFWTPSPSPPSYGTDDMAHEKYGPHVDYLLIDEFDNSHLAYESMKADLADFTDWPLSKSERDEVLNQPFYGGTGTEFGVRLAPFEDLGMFELDFQNAKWPTGWPGQVDLTTLTQFSPDPNIRRHYAAREFRKAVSHLLDKDDAIASPAGAGGMGVRIDTPMPPAKGKDYIYLEGWEYDPVTGAYLGNYPYDYSLATASAVLTAAGFYDWDADGRREWKDPVTGVVEELPDIILYTRVSRPPDARQYYGTKVSDNLNALGVVTDNRIRTVWGVIYPVFVSFDFHLYTGGWRLGGPDIDFLESLYHSRYIRAWWPNYPNVNILQLDKELEKLRFAVDKPTAIAAGKASQRILLEQSAVTPVNSGKGFTAYRAYTTRDGKTYNWEGFINQQGLGLFGFWSILDARLVDPATGAKVKPGTGALNTLRFALREHAKTLNPVTSQWVYEHEIIGMVYDGLGALNPYNLAEDMPHMVMDWEVGKWFNPVTGDFGTRITQYLRPGIEFVDYDVATGTYKRTPVTSADVKFSMEYQRDQGGWGYGNVADIVNIATPDDLTVVIDYSFQSMWTLHWTWGIYIIPKYIWETVPDAWTYDPLTEDTIIGSGPFTFDKADQVDIYEAVLLRRNPNYMYKDGIRPDGFFISPNLYMSSPGRVRTNVRIQIVETRTVTITITTEVEVDGRVISTTTTVTTTETISRSVWQEQVIEVPGDAIVTLVTTIDGVTANLTRSAMATRTGDINLDFIVDVFDATLLSIHFGHSWVEQADGYWDAPDADETGLGWSRRIREDMAADLDNAGYIEGTPGSRVLTIDVFDATLLATNFGLTWP